MLKIIKALLTISLLSLFVSCYGSWNFLYEGNNVDKRTRSLRYISDSTDEEFQNAHISNLSGQYNVLIVSDLHFGNTKKDVNCSSIFAWLESHQGDSDFPEFAISLGDVVDLGRQNEYDLYNEFCNRLLNYGIKVVFNTCGNHDIYQGNWENWKSNCYPHTSLYKFKTSRFSWYSLDTASGTIGINQYNLIHANLESDSRPKIIFTHYPFVRFNVEPSNMAETTERNLLISDFANNNVKCVLGGHNHTQTEDNLGFMDYGIPSFGYDNVWAILHVNEDAGTAYVEYIRG